MTQPIDPNHPGAYERPWVSPGTPPWANTSPHPVYPAPKRSPWPWIVGGILALMVVCCGVVMVSASLTAPNPAPSWTIEPGTTGPVGPVTQEPPSPSDSPNVVSPEPAALKEDGNEENVYFSNCAEALDRHPGGVLSTTPGYRKALDRDGDGVACEPNG